MHKLSSLNISTLYVDHTLSLCCSLREWHKKLLAGELLQNRINSNDNSGGSHGTCDNEIVHAVWELVQLSASRNAVAVTSLVSDFLSRVCRLA